MDDNKRQADHRHPDDQVPSKARPEAQDDYHPDAAKAQPDDANRRKHQSLRRGWRASGPVTRLTVVFTGVIALATVLYATSSAWTLYEIHRGSRDTHALAEAAKKQADKAETISGFIRQAATAMDTSNTQAKGALDKTLSQNKQGLDATIAASRLDQRAWVGAIEISAFDFKEGAKRIFNIIIINTGKTPALKVKIIATSRAQRRIEKFVPIYENLPQELSVVTIFPGMRMNMESGTDDAPRLIAEDLNVLRFGEIVLRVYGKISYEDTFGGVHHTTFCMAFPKGLPSLPGACPTYNDAD